MKKIIQLFICMTLLTLNVFSGKSQEEKHIVLISIDGFHPDMYLDPKWPTPNLQQLMKKGTYAKFVKSVFPSYTYPSHTAILTGALPARSGIYFNQPKGSLGEWNWMAKYIKVPTIWQVLHKAGLTTAAVMWPGSVGADINYNVSEIWPVNDPEDRITATRKYATPAGLVEEIEKNATGKLTKENMSDGLLSLDENAGRMAAYIFKTYKPAFLAVHFAEVDGAEHNEGRDGDSVRLAIAANDRAIGNILEAIQKSGLKDSTTIIIVGDHGFCTIHTVLRPNILIRDLNARFTAAGGSALLYGDINTEHKVIKRLDSLPNEQRKLFRIINRKEMNKMGADSGAILALTAIPGTVFNGAITANNNSTGPGTVIRQNNMNGFVSSTTGGHHGYDPNLPDMYTGFIAAGAGVNRGSVITELCVTDIAPLIAKLLGIEFKTPDGKLIPGILKMN
jgi:predicted AlkP superfamily pyrophosphatase or phosphodiesterase